MVALAQDRDGILWIGTLDGVATFDGRSIVPVADVAGAPLRGLIAAIVARRAGGVYVASPAGLHIFDGSAWRLVATKRGIVSIAESRDGVLWMTDSAGALWTLGPRDQWQLHKEMTSAAVAVAAGNDGSVWAASDTNAFRIHDGRADVVAGAPLPGRPAALLVARDGKLWVATQTCSVHWTQSGSDGWHQVAFTPWPRGAFRELAEDRRGRIWAVSYGGHVAFGNATMPWTVWGQPNGPFDAGVMSVLGDREGSVWFGLNAVGLVEWVGEEWSHRGQVDPTNPGRGAFSAFGLARTADPGGLLVSVFSAGVLRLNPDGTTRQYTTADGITEDVRAAVEPEPGTLYVGTRFGLFESIHGSRFKQVIKLPSGFVMGLFRSPDNHWYAATSTAGVYVRDRDGWRPVPEINSALDNLHVRGMTWLANGDLWVATLRGVNIFRDGVAAGHLSSRTVPAIPDSVNAVIEVGDDIWVAGTGGIAIRHAGAWRRMTEASGIPGQTIYSLAPARDGSVWAGGSAGVGHFANGQWRVWDSREGLLQEECNLNGLVVQDDGSVYVATMGGLAHFDPTVKHLPPPPLGLIWLSTPARDANGIAQLSSGERALHLRWTAPWLGPHPVQYRFRVPRLHETWSPATSEDHLDVENLAAGDWRVEVEARVEGTRDWSQPLVLDVSVPPFWWETFPARLGMGLLLGMIIYLIVRLRMRALRRHAAMLEATVRQRTAELAEKVELLRDSEQRALAASRAKSVFLANMSHELRTPLNGVLGFAQLMARRPNRDVEDRHGLDVIIKSGEHLLRLINQILSLSKIEAGRVTLEETQFDLGAVVADIDNLFRLRAEEKGLRFITDMADPLPAALVGDEVRLRQILLNLAGNAVKFTERGSVTLCVRWHEGRARFDIEDTGPGIAADDLPRLFEPFVQTEAGQRSREGTGLGLAVSRNLARLMDGDITVESTPGIGSRFRVDVALPAAGVESLVRERRVASLAPGQPPVRILVVDDTELNRTVLRKLLTSVGFDVREATSGEEAFAAWRAWQPHLIWMDKRMPGVDGLETTRRIRAEEKAGGRKHVPIVALSASALDHERGEILEAGCDDFVAKPFRESVIFEKIAEHVGVKYAYDDDNVGRTSVRLPESVSPAAGSASVLLVDDDRICLHVATEMLRAKGIGVTVATSGSEALDLIAKQRFDIVMMDLHMPVMGGVETARRIRANDGAPRIPIIAMSADTFDGERARLEESGMDDYVAKPVEPEALAAVLKKWLA